MYHLLETGCIQEYKNISKHETREFLLSLKLNYLYVPARIEFSSLFSLLEIKAYFYI